MAVLVGANVTELNCLLHIGAPITIAINDLPNGSICKITLADKDKNVLISSGNLTADAANTVLWRLEALDTEALITARFINVFIGPELAFAGNVTPLTLWEPSASPNLTIKYVAGPFPTITWNGGVVTIGGVQSPDLMGPGTPANTAILASNAAVAAAADAQTARQGAEDALADAVELVSVYGRGLQISQAVARFGARNAVGTADFYTFRSVYHVWDSAVKNTGAVYGLSVPSLAGVQAIFRTLDGGESWTKLGSVTVNLAANELLEHIFVEPYYETILVVKNMNTSLNNSYSLLTLDNACILKATLDLGANRTWHGGMQAVDAVDKSGDYATRIIMFAEYTNSRATSARILKSTDKGLTWSVMLERTANAGVSGAGEIRHFHCCQVDPFTKHWWVSSGDTDSQCYIWRSTDEGVTWDVILSGDQSARALGFVFEDGYLYYGMDSPHLGAQSKIYRLDTTTLVRTEVAAVPDGLAIYMTTRMFYPAGFLVWTADELGTAESVGVYFFDYRTQQLSSVWEFAPGAAGTGMQEASRYQDRETGLVWCRPSSALFRGIYGYGGTSATLSEILKARMV